MLVKISNGLAGVVMPYVGALIKPASGRCGLNCGYCFYRDEMTRRDAFDYGLMSEATLENVIRKTLAFAEGRCVIALQGGEPTLRGLDFFRLLVELEKRYNVNGVQIQNAVQTNAYRLSGGSRLWADFFAENKFLVGVSLDGRRDTHNMYRRTPSGGETFFDVLDTIHLLDKAGADYNILTVVHSGTARQAGKLYSFYKRNKWRYLQFIPCIEPPDSAASGYTLDAESYGMFLCELFDCWYADWERGVQPYIRQFENYIGILLGAPPEACEQSGICANQNVIEADGSVYPCDFYALDKYRLGNLNTDSFSDINKRLREIRFIEASTERMDACADCGYFAICRGGCRRNRTYEDGQGVSRFCRAYRMFFDHALGRMKRIAAELR